MSTKDELADMAIVALVLYCLVGVVGTYPALIVGWLFWVSAGPDAGFVTWLVSIGILWLLVKCEAWVLIVIIYLIALVPFIFLCSIWYQEMYGG